jgi:hypothetical protein
MPLVREATETARASEPIEILNHSLDTLLFAELVAKSKAFPHDVETVYVAQSCTTPAWRRCKGAETSALRWTARTLPEKS